MEEVKSNRLMSLDALRGLDMFFLVMFGHVMRPLDSVLNRPWTNAIAAQLRHRRWEGLNFEDFLMPIFLFCCGTAIPFAFKKYREQGRSKSQVYFRIFRRFVLLWILGMINQGGLLTLNINSISFYNNTLQAIAIGYMVSALLFINTKPRTQLIVAFSILIGYWAFLSFGVLDGVRSEFTIEMDMCMRLGHKLASALPVKVLAPWLVCWPGFIVTVMSGMFAGEWLLGSGSQKEKLLGLFGFGAAMVAAGFLLNLQMPIIKETWDSSFILVTSGMGFILLGVFYFIVDYKGWRKSCAWLLPIGMNAMFAYMIGVFVRFSYFTDPILFGLNRFVSPELYIFIRSAADVTVLYLLLYHLYKRKIFIRI